jgi:transposase
MEDRELFGLALGLQAPWYIDRVTLDVQRRELNLWIDFARGGEFTCPECAASGCKAYDSQEKTWRHLDFFQYRTTLTARSPRVSCHRCGIRPAALPWARPESGFTLLLEALILRLAKQMPVKALAQLLGEHDTRIWRIIRHYVADARAERDDSQVRNVAVDETASRRGQTYVSLFADLDARRVLFVTDGRDSGTVKSFAEDLRAHGGDPERIEEVCADMSVAFQKGIREALPNAALTFDKFHVIALANDAVDKTRRSERAAHPELKGQRYALLRNPQTMTEAQLEFGAKFLAKSTLKTARAYHLRIALQDIYLTARSIGEARDELLRWCGWAQRSRIPEMIRVGRTIRHHLEGVLRWFTSRFTNGFLEAINSLVQAAKSRARGYRTTANLATVIYLIAGKLDFRVTLCR